MENPKLRQIEAFPVEATDQQTICLRDPHNYAENPLLVPPNVFLLSASLMVITQYWIYRLNIRNDMEICCLAIMYKKLSRN